MLTKVILFADTLRDFDQDFSRLKIFLAEAKDYADEENSFWQEMKFLEEFAGRLARFLAKNTGQIQNMANKIEETLNPGNKSELERYHKCLQVIFINILKDSFYHSLKRIGPDYSIHFLKLVETFDGSSSRSLPVKGTLDFRANKNLVLNYMMSQTKFSGVIKKISGEIYELLLPKEYELNKGEFLTFK
jgi:hypothetical protein